MTLEFADFGKLSSNNNDKNLLGSPYLPRGGCSDCTESGIKKR
jgi:hypothetical protein